MILQSEDEYGYYSYEAFGQEEKAEIKKESVPPPEQTSEKISEPPAPVLMIQQQGRIPLSSSMTNEKLTSS